MQIIQMYISTANSFIAKIFGNVIPLVDYANAAQVHLLELYSALHHTADVMLLTVVDIIKFVV